MRRSRESNFRCHAVEPQEHVELEASPAQQFDEARRDAIGLSRWNRIPRHVFLVLVLTHRVPRTFRCFLTSDDGPVDERVTLFAEFVVCVINIRAKIMVKSIKDRVQVRRKQGLPDAAGANPPIAPADVVSAQRQREGGQAALKRRARCGRRSAH